MLLKTSDRLYEPEVCNLPLHFQTHQLPKKNPTSPKIKPTHPLKIRFHLTAAQTHAKFTASSPDTASQFISDR